MSARVIVATVLACARLAGASEWGHPPPPPPPPNYGAPGGYDAYGAPPPPPQQQPSGGYPGYEDAASAAYEAANNAAPAVERGGALVRVAGAASGGALSYGLSRAATGAGRVTWGGGGAALCLVAGCTGGRFGDAALALGATTLGGLRGSRKLADGRYPVFRQLKAAAGLVSREPWPPESPNPWKYAKRRAEDPDFSMPAALIAACALAGAGANVAPLPPLVPSSLVATLAAGCGLFAVTLRDARGDAARCVCARAVASVRVVLAAASEARLGEATVGAARLGGLRLGAFDRRFGISKTLGKLFAGAVEQAQQANADAGGQHLHQQRQQQQRRPQQAPPPPPQAPYAAAGDDWGLPPR